MAATSLHRSLTSFCKKTFLPFSFTKKRQLPAVELRLSRQQSDNLKWQQDSFHRMLNLMGLCNEGILGESDVTAFRIHLLETLIAAPLNNEPPDILTDKLVFLQVIQNFIISIWFLVWKQNLKSFQMCQIIESCVLEFLQIVALLFLVLQRNYTVLCGLALLGVTLCQMHIRGRVSCIEEAIVAETCSSRCWNWCKRCDSRWMQPHFRRRMVIYRFEGWDITVQSMDSSPGE